MSLNEETKQNQEINSKSFFWGLIIFSCLLFVSIQYKSLIDKKIVK